MNEHLYTHPSLTSSLPPANLPSTQSLQRFRPFPSSKHHVTKGRYITSNDPRGYIPVYEYPLNSQWIMMDVDDGYILWTGIWKALGNAKADIVKMIESQPELAPQLRRVRGGYLKIQGTWMPYEVAVTLARRVAWTIRDDLIPFFGPDFPSTCLSPSDPCYGQVIPNASNRRKSRRVTAPVPPRPNPIQTASNGPAPLSLPSAGLSLHSASHVSASNLPYPISYSGHVSASSNDHPYPHEVVASQSHHLYASSQSRPTISTPVTHGYRPSSAPGSSQQQMSETAGYYASYQQLTPSDLEFRVASQPGRTNIPHRDFLGPTSTYETLSRPLGDYGYQDQNSTLPTSPIASHGAHHRHPDRANLASRSHRYRPYGNQHADAPTGQMTSAGYGNSDTSYSYMLPSDVYQFPGPTSTSPHLPSPPGYSAQAADVAQYGTPTSNLPVYNNSSLAMPQSRAHNDSDQTYGRRPLTGNDGIRYRSNDRERATPAHMGERDKKGTENTEPSTYSLPPISSMETSRQHIKEGSSSEILKRLRSEDFAGDNQSDELSIGFNQEGFHAGLERRRSLSEPVFYGSLSRTDPPPVSSTPQWPSGYDNTQLWDRQTDSSYDQNPSYKIGIRDANTNPSPGNSAGVTLVPQTALGTVNPLLETRSLDSSTPAATTPSAG